MLYDKEFLLNLDKQKNRVIYARITALSFDEFPIETIEGRVTGGSINLDGASALRRTCSLTIIAADFNYDYYYWGLNSKFKLEIGIENTVDSSMPNIIWFNQGIYLITQFNTSRSTNNFTITINGKDKMCLLNGEVSGALESSVDFGVIEEENVDGIWETRKIPIQDIIRNMVHTYAKEPYHNIIINDLDMVGLELLEYRLDAPIYFWKNANGDDIYDNYIINNASTKVYQVDEKGVVNETAKTLAEVDDQHLDPLTSTGMEEKPLPVRINNKDGNDVILTKVQYGQTVGYRATDLVYPKDLIANIGETITSVLDKIKNMLTEFEYFYNVDGQFIFQKKKSSASTLWSPSGDIYQNMAVSNIESSNVAYSFYNGEFTTAFNNNPNLLNVKNDYSIWGQRTTLSGAEVPIHMRYAIDNKPTKYTSIEVNYGNYMSNPSNGVIWYDPNKNYELIFLPGEDFEAIDEYNKKYGVSLSGQTSITYSINDYDWREIIYRMACDYYKYGHLDNFEMKVIEANPDIFPTGKTGYEQYYIDLQGFWRQLYNPELNTLQISNQITELKNNIEYYKTWVIPEIKTAITNKDKAIVNAISKGQSDITKLLSESLSLQTSLNNVQNYMINWEQEIDKLNEKIIEIEETISEGIYYTEKEDNKYWNKDVFNSPEMLNFWFDFLDVEGELQQFNVNNIGSRSKSINDTVVKSIYYRDIPQVIFYSPDEEIINPGGYKIIQISKEKMESMFSISSQGKSAKDKLDELIYQHGYCIETATVTSIPIYYLEPNSRIYIYDEETGLNGEYLASKITLPLTYKGTMSITATKAVEDSW